MVKIKELNVIKQNTLDVKLTNEFEKVAYNYLMIAIDLELCIMYTEKYEGDTLKCFLRELVDERHKKLTCIDNDVTDNLTTTEKIINARLEDLVEIESERTDDSTKVLLGEMAPETFIRRYGKLYKELVNNAIYFDVNNRD